MFSMVVRSEYSKIKQTELYTAASYSTYTDMHNSTELHDSPHVECECDKICVHEVTTETTKKMVDSSVSSTTDLAEVVDQSVANTVLRQYKVLLHLNR